LVHKTEKNNNAPGGTEALHLIIEAKVELILKKNAFSSVQKYTGNNN
jgi:hypothetical protein